MMKIFKYCCHFLREKGRDLTGPMTKAPTPTDKSKKKQRDNIKTPPKTSLSHQWY